MRYASVLWIMLAVLFVHATKAESKGPQRHSINEKRPQANAGDEVCEQVRVIGSRLAVKRVCMTRLEWEEKKTLDRDFIQRIQFPMGGLRDGG